VKGQAKAIVTKATKAAPLSVPTLPVKITTAPVKAAAAPLSVPALSVPTLPVKITTAPVKAAAAPLSVPSLPSLSTLSLTAPKISIGKGLKQADIVAKVESAAATLKSEIKSEIKVGRAP
jgi:hypothetical protein